MSDIPGAHNRLWHPELAKRDEKVKPMSDEEFRRRVEAIDAERKVLDTELNRRLKEADE